MATTRPTVCASSAAARLGATVAGFQYQTNRLGQRTVVTDTLPLAPAISATRIKTISFEGANLIDPTTGADALSTAKPTLESSAPLKSAYSARIPNTGSTYLQENFSGVNELYVSFYLKLTALPAATTQIALISNGATPVGNLRITSGGILQLYNNATLLGSGATALTAGTLYRIGLHQKKGTGSNAVLEVYLASGDALFGSPSFANTTQTFIT